MVQAIEILKDGSQECYQSDDIEIYDDLVCVSNPDLPRIDLTKVKSMEIADKIEQIQEDRDFLEKYEPTYHPTEEEIEKAEKERQEKRDATWLTSAIVIFILALVFFA